MSNEAHASCEAERFAPALPTRTSGPSFALGHRLHRALWRVSWACLAAWTPPPLSPWRIALLKFFGARVGRGAAIAASTRVWLPRHLELGPGATLGPGVDCYNMAPIRIGARAIISQRAFLCGGTHDIGDPTFPLVARPIEIGADAWVASEAFVGPGVTVADGGVIGARACVFADTLPWTVYRGNPAAPVKPRVWRPVTRPAKRRLRINCVLGPYLPVPPVRGGAVERIFLNICEAMAEDGHDVRIISRRWAPFPVRERLNGVDHLRVASRDQPSRKWLYRVFDIVYALRVSLMLPDADVTITHSVALPLVIQRKKAGLIYVSAARFPKNQMFLYRRADRIQAVSSHIASAIRTQSPSVARKVKAIPNAISQTFAEALEKSSARETEVLFVGRLAREKGIDVLIRAFLQVHAVHSDWRLTIVGPHRTEDGGDGEGFLTELRALGAPAAGAIAFSGPIYNEKELAAILQRAEIFVYPSVAAQGEASPLAPVEAMACGCAVVVSSLDCFSDYLEHAKNGLVYDVADSSGEALAQTLEQLMIDPDLRHRLAEAARRTARRYTRDAVARLFIDDIESLLSRTSHHADLQA